ncbi:hypothetical protein [Clostridium mediterraneense]|uniref:hypothetical protein n=1 Tax=Clostridium mediterraneense TaxID=1805472 RepID=UPI000836655D|nr:hypothetical protein [Clostridium mediterraneense]
MRSKGKDLLINCAVGLNYFVEFILFLVILSCLGIVVQSEALVSWGFVIALSLTWLVNYVRLKPAIFYIIAIPLIGILLYFVPKVLL